MLVGRGVPAEPSNVRAAHPEGSPCRSEAEIVAAFGGLIQKITLGETCVKQNKLSG